MKVANSFRFTNGQIAGVAPATAPSAPANASTITLDAATKAAVVRAIMNSFDIFASNDAAKIRNYYLTELQNAEEKAQFKAMSDSQLLQVAANALANAGKPSADLATDPAATWKVDGNTVTVTVQETTGVNVTYQAAHVNGAWQ